MEKEILIKFLNGKCTPGEASQVKEWLEKPGSKSEIDSILQKSWETASESHDFEALEKIRYSLKSKIDLPKKGRSRSISSFSWILKVAAVFVVFGTIGFGVVKYGYNEEPVKQEEVTVFTKTTRVGEKLKLRLPDQSFVILNSNSSLVFNSDFGKEIRDVTLIGEAYFEVASNKEVPFVVHSGELTTTAIGTEFNVLSRDGNHTIALTEGKVRVEIESNKNASSEPSFLEPGKMATFNNDTNTLEVNDFSPEVLTAWKEGRIRIKRESLEDIITNLQTWYGVDFTVSNRVNVKRRISGEFNNESLENILEGLSFSLNFKYSINENHVTLK